MGALIFLSDALASVNAQVAYVDGGVLAVLQTGPARPGYAPERDVQHTMSASEVQPTFIRGSQRKHCRERTHR